MKCQFCQKEKVYDVTEIENGKAALTLQLCEDCFKKYIQTPEQKCQSLVQEAKAADNFVKEMIGFVENIVGQIMPKGPLVVPPYKQPCPRCKITLQEIAQKGRLGCPECYEWYKEELQQTLSLAHGMPEELIHKGKVPKNKSKPKSIPETDKMRLVKLKYKMAASIDKEDYEQAAKLRDQIKELEVKLLSTPKNDEGQ